MKRLFLLSVTFLMSYTVMAKEIKTEIVIQAAPEKIWKILTDFENYPQWNPFIVSVTGDVENGNKIVVSIKPPDRKVMIFKPIILNRINNKELSWQGKLLFKGLFDGKHKFELIDNGDGTTTFIQSEKFSGIFVWLFNPRNTKKGFNEMNQKLKELAESK
ncbi:SRPBCC domain-containing protein [Elizabethkingia anophelis]|uniref:SRPBCC domain-containing protein n=1 Tax=Elizabethkingia anophelis TaxID=1117645 RepID=UPI0009953DFE|nr:SRPBCC domain-containing protein [Elizabethkingia anophelis]MDV3548931.1 SRPBCC domain-containing protein [Elizabethkingia anophelis]MDV3561682.1 SRPBCC domain-containing protein [Elizabethkingia anophelis]MDV3625694.1 SRPBCC domain-containing protein [Elizabethkingia anophelis]MDV3641861.1 SRPBCC domain-containing protein [Elizabethkingia anophelis]MDV3656245.1 SRPBCC domain-containing protein [Elizabethkingia anophelis]